MNPFVKLVPDLRVYLSDFLAPVDLMSLRLTCKFNRDKFKMPNFRELFKRRILPMFGLGTMDDAEKFCRVLYKCKAMVSGSFILDCIRGTDFHGDIDVYHPDGREEKVRPIDGYVPYWVNSQFSYYLHINNFELIQERQHAMDVVPTFCHNSRERTDKDKFTLQLVRVTPRRILSSFDLDICKNGFDGKNLYVRSWEKLIYKHDEILPNHQLICSWYIRSEKELRKICARRTKKYTARGFVITQHPKFKEIFKYMSKMTKIHVIDILEEEDLKNNSDKFCVNLDIFSTCHKETAKIPEVDFTKYIAHHKKKRSKKHREFWPINFVKVLKFE
jgi:hypothetical protein